MMNNISLILLLTSSLSSIAGAENIRIAVWHTNDVHGWIMPREASFYEKNPKRLIGGGAAFARALAKEKDPKLLLDAGDWFQGTPEGSLTQGRAVADVFNALGYDALEVGNHEFDYGQDVLKALIKRMKAPVLGANIYDAKTGKRVDWVKPWIVKDVAGVKVGVFGLLTTGMGRLVLGKQREGLEFRREVDEAEAAVAQLKRQGATVIIALDHLGFETPDGPPFAGDQTIAASVPGIDLIVGGHSHTMLREPVRDATHGTLIVQAGSALSMAGRVGLEIDPKTGKVVKSEGKLIDLWVDELGEAPALAAIVSKHVEAVGKAMEVVVATAATPLVHDRKVSIESALGDWMTDCAREWSKTDIALQNSGGIRASIAAGPLTKRHLFNIMPFDNALVNLTMSGSQIREVLERGAASRGLIQISGMKVVYNPAKPMGGRIVSASVGAGELKNDGVYTVTTVDFLAEGGDGYEVFRSVEKKEFTGKLLRDVMEWCAKRQGSIRAPDAGRIQKAGG